MRPIIAITKLPVLISTVYYGLIFAWVVGLNTTLSIFLTRFYHFGPKQIGQSLLVPDCAIHFLMTSIHRAILLHPYDRGGSGRVGRALDT